MDQVERRTSEGGQMGRQQVWADHSPPPRKKTCSTYKIGHNKTTHLLPLWHPTYPNCTTAMVLSDEKGKQRLLIASFPFKFADRLLEAGNTRLPSSCDAIQATRRIICITILGVTETSQPLPALLHYLSLP